MYIVYYIHCSKKIIDNDDRLIAFMVPYLIVKSTLKIYPKSIWQRNNNFNYSVLQLNATRAQELMFTMQEMSRF